MKESDKGQFANLMTSLGILHNRKLSSELISIYWHALKSYEYSQIQACMNHLIRDPDIGQFMPKPADVVAYIEGKSSTRSLKAWNKVLWAIRHVGAWDSVEFDDHKIHAVIMEMGGWTHLCKCSTKDLPFLAREFEKLYCVEMNQIKQEYPNRLAGKLELLNGYCKENTGNEVRFIGDKAVGNTSTRLEHNNV